jgi:hypothetical protein
MKTLKRILLLILALVALMLIVAAFVKKEYSLEREITVNKPKPEVFDYVRYLKNQDNYSVWSQIDPDMKKEFSGADGTVGFVSAWESDDKRVGKGKQEITGITEGDRIDYELRFKEPFESTAYTYMICESTGEHTTLVKWGFSGRMNYPMNLMLLFMNMEGMLAPDFENGLTRLKQILEAPEN